MIEQYQRDWAATAGAELKEYSEGGYRTVLARKPGGEWREPDWEAVYLDSRAAPASEARTHVRALKRKDKRAKRPASSGGKAYCSKCNGPHVYKHGRA